MIKRAKYPLVGNDYTGFQGFGSLYGGNQVSDVTNIERNETTITDNGSDWAS